MPRPCLAPTARSLHPTAAGLQPTVDRKALSLEATAPESASTVSLHFQMTWSEETTMRRFMNAVWLLGSLMAASAALVVTVAHAAPRTQASGAEGWSTDELAVLASLGLQRLPPEPEDPSNAIERLPAAAATSDTRPEERGGSSPAGSTACIGAGCLDPRHLGHIELPQADGGTTTVFYPTDAAEAAVRKGPFELSWAQDGEPRRGNGRLVVISHGSGGSPWVHVDLARVLVGRGFTVAIPQHAGDNVQDPSEPGPGSWARRPLEVSQAIDRVAAHRLLAPLLRLDAVGVFGGSAGGHTALTLAGGRWSPSRFRDHCLRNIEQDFSSCVGFITLQRGDGLDGIKAWAARLVIRLRFSDATPQGHTDPRIGAAVAMVPFAADFDPQSLRRPRVPLALVIADQDVNQVPRFHVEAVRAACEPRCEVLQRLAEGGHGAMLSPLPPLETGSVAHRLLSDPPAFDRALVLPLLHADIVEFFVQRLAPAR